MDVQKSWAIGNNFIKEAIKLSSEILDSLNKKIPEVPTQQLVFYDFAIRAHCCLEASRLLWGEFLNQKRFKLSLAIQLRVGVLDFITFIYLYDFRKDEAKFKIEYDRLNHTFYSWLENNMKTSPPESREEVDKFLKIHFPLKFEPAGGIKDKIKAPTILNMKEATESSDLGEYIPTAYNLYRMFSQYEHYSEVSRKFMVREVEHDLELFMVAIDCVFMLQYFSFQLLNIEREFITRYRNLHHHYLLSYGEGQVVKV